jgi:Ca-activated chloride channel family protein
MKGATAALGLLCMWVVATPDTGWADSVAAKNKAGNRQYQKGQFQEAEKAYLDAQLEDPGRPELLYNLGNTLLKQKKFDKAAQSLRQAISKGDRGLQANGWYNLGNSLFESNNYQDSAQAYIQALKINPADRDAKHNLELAWRKMQEQKKTSKDQKDDKQKPGDKKDQQQGQNSPDGKQDQSKPKESQGANQPETQQPSQAERKEGSMSKDRAMQILDAMKNQELMDQKKLAERLAKRKSGGKDW